MEVLALFLGGLHGDTIPPDSIQQREFKLFIGGVHVDQQVVNLIQNFLRPGVFPVDFVDHHNNFKAGFQGLF